MLLLGVLAILALGLTVAMFLSRQAMLGFPAAIFWMVLGAAAYIRSATPWVSIEFYIALASMLGMVPFSVLAANGLREKKDTGTDRDEYMDEGRDNESYYGERNESEDRLFDEADVTRRHQVVSDDVSDIVDDELTPWNSRKSSRREALHQRAAERRNRLRARVSRRLD